MNLYLTKSGRLRRHDNTLRFEKTALPPEETPPEQEEEALDEKPAEAVHIFPVESVDAVYVFGEITLNSKLINFLNSRKIPIHFFNWFGHHTGTLFPHAEQLSGDLVIRQGEAYRTPEERLAICRALLEATFHNIRSIVLYYQRRKGGLEEAAETISFRSSVSCLFQQLRRRNNKPCILHCFGNQPDFSRDKRYMLN